MLVALSIAEQLRGSTISNEADEQLESKILLCVRQEVMLASNLWVEIGLVNGALAQVQKIIYATTEKPPQLPLFAIVCFGSYTGTPWDPNHPLDVPITPLT